MISRYLVSEFSVVISTANLYFSDMLIHPSSRRHVDPLKFIAAIQFFSPFPIGKDFINKKVGWAWSGLGSHDLGFGLMGLIPTRPLPHPRQADSRKREMGPPVTAQCLSFFFFFFDNCPCLSYCKRRKDPAAPSSSQRKCSKMGRGGV
jgi:hypothetical protein